MIIACDNHHVINVSPISSSHDTMITHIGMGVHKNRLSLALRGSEYGQSGLQSQQILSDSDSDMSYGRLVTSAVAAP